MVLLEYSFGDLSYPVSSPEAVLRYPEATMFQGSPSYLTQVTT